MESVYTDKRRDVSNSRIKIGDHVMINQKRENMLTPYYDPKPFTFIGIKGSMITAARGTEIKSRNSSQFRRLEQEERDPIEISREDTCSITEATTEEINSWH